ncbi:MAG: hypothetical protein QNL04_07615 [SAR324 cluster bacterium]|nr:hypothetical protein [SAR324 cluster bacterium]
MQNRIKMLLLVTASLIGLFSCKETTQTAPQGEYAATATANVVLSVDTAVIGSHITVYNSALEYKSGSTSNVSPATTPTAKNKGTASQGVALTLLAETTAPTVNGLTLQASDVAIKGDYAYVTYNYSGDTYAGALQVVDISDEENPEVIQEILFYDLELNVVYVKGSRLIAGGAANVTTRGFDSPAVLLSTKLSKGKSVGTFTLVDLPSYAVTGLTAKGSNVYASVGDVDGGFARLELNKLADFEESLDFYAYKDSRSIAIEGNLLGLLRGTDGAVSYFSISNLEKIKTLSDSVPLGTATFTDTATITHSKATIDLVGSVTLLALGDGGVKITLSSAYDTSELYALDQVTSYESLADTKTVTNASSADKNLLFRANGEAGVDLYQLSDDVRDITATATATKVGEIDFGSEISANSVYYQKGFLFVASGLGGMKIIGVDRDTTSTDDETEDDESEDKDEDDEYDD